MVDLPGTLGFRFDCVLCQDLLGQVKEGCLTVGLRTKQEKTVWSEGLGSGVSIPSCITGPPVFSLSLSYVLYKTVSSNVLLGDEPLLAPAW